MSNELFEISFSGQISAGADLNDVKAKLGKMFNADAAKLAQLFSGKRIVIKKNADRATANKYKTALNRAGGECSVTPMPSAQAPTGAARGSASAAAPKSAPSGSYEATGSGHVAPPPQTTPLSISAGQIEDLAVSMAPVGSAMQDAINPVAEPSIDISGFDMAPVGSTMGTAAKDAEPPPPDTSGIEMLD